MASMDYWAEAPMCRQQLALFSPTLDAMIGEDHPVRLLDEVLGLVDWSLWEAEYDGQRGQPPIHPQVIAGAILYGLSRGIRSTRQLEDACCHRLDFIWLVEGREIDYSTFAKFRTRFGGPLKDLFRQIGRVAMEMGLIRLCEVGFDGTRVKANNSRYNTRIAATLEEKLAALDALFDQAMAEWDASEQERARQRTLEGLSDESPAHLPPELADLKRRRERVRAALDKARALDEVRKKDGIDPAKNPAQAPLADPESRVMPNKEGGYAPNYTPTATTDGQRGFIVDCEVTGEVNETAQAVPSVERIEENFGQHPAKFLTDSGNNSGAVQQAMEALGVEFYAPVESNEPQVGNPARRADPTQSVPESEWPNLPRNGNKQLAKSCFVYDAEQDQYYCPLGQSLPYAESKPDMRQGQKVQCRVYRCATCAGCPLAAQCVSPQSKRGRSISRDEFEDVRERTAARMSTDAAKQIYHQRPRIAETTFGILKAVFRLRQFLLSGLEKVRIEWRWAATAFNVIKLVRNVARLRADFARTLATTED